MKRLLIMLAFGLAACSSTLERQHNQLMQQVEDQVVLPKGTKKLEQYARYYAANGDRIVAVYITFVDPANKYYDLPTGQRRWLDDHRNLPATSDGGCSIVNVIYDPRGRSLPEAVCNGVA